LSRPRKSIEFGQNVHEVLKKYGNSKYTHLLFKFCFLPLMTVLQVFFALCFMNKMLEKSRQVMVLKFLNLVFKRY